MRGLLTLVLILLGGLIAHFPLLFGFSILSFFHPLILRV